MITVPTLILDEEKCRQNIKRMAEVARASVTSFRPHFKTHVSAEIGEWFREEGVKKITVSSLRMAEYFARAGWDDILVAFPFNLPEIELASRLASEVNLSLLVESNDVASFLSANLGSTCNVYIKIDTGLRRTGIPHDDYEEVARLADHITSLRNLNLKGLLTHAGHSYKARSHNEILAVHNSSLKAISDLHSGLSERFPGLIVSVGDTPGCSVAGDFSMVAEIRPGNFVFYDYTQVLIGSCSPEQVAVAMACPVVAVHPDRCTVILYGGAIHFSRESVTLGDGRTVYGAVVRNSGNRWGGLYDGAYLTGMSQEHGIVTVPPSMANHYKPGDIIMILPAHSCITAHVMGEYRTCEGRIIERMR